jgi:hypothetical protein
MKKQLLIMIVALFALGISGAYAQTTCPLPRTVTCLSPDALHPIAGTPYNYEVTVPTPPGTKSYQWYVTQDPNFIAGGILNSGTADPIGGTLVNAVNPPAAYNVSTLNQNTISITWQSFTYNPANPVFVVINVVNDNGTCNTQNLKVYRIEPLNAFTLDLANVDQAGGTMAYDATNSFCIHDVVSATYDATAPEGVIYDFGVDYMYFVVTAANWNTSWMPSIQLAGIDPEETVAVEWAYSTSTPAAYTAAGTFTLAAGTWTTATPVLAQAAGGNVGPGGECILIRVTLDHSNGALNYEGLANEAVTLAVDGVTNLVGPTIPDIHYSDIAPVANALCGLADGFQFDVATQTLTARPDIQTGGTMPAPGLLPVKP